MNGLSFTSFLKGFTKIALACTLVFAASLNSFAQYRGAPVKKDRLIKALRSKQLQTRDIVTVINSNGVDFVLTPETRDALVAAGARPEVLKAVGDNLRVPSSDDSTFAKNKRKSDLQNYEDLLDQAMLSYKDKDSNTAVRFLETAVKINPRKPEAYQLLGFVNLYGLNNAARAERLMRESYNNGGSAVFRVYHDDTGSFGGRCSGSLYVSPTTIRFESDDNRHTFETSTVNVDKFRLDTESNKNWKDYPVFKMMLKFGKDKAKFRFAPISGKQAESEMVERFVYVSKNNINFTNAAVYR